MLIPSEAMVAPLNAGFISGNGNHSRPPHAVLHHLQHKDWNAESIFSSILHADWCSARWIQGMSSVAKRRISIAQFDCRS